MPPRAPGACFPADLPGGLIDGSAGRAPEDIDEFDYVEYNARDQLLDVDLDALDRQPMPS